MIPAYLAKGCVRTSAPRSTYTKYVSLAVLSSALPFIQIFHESSRKEDVEL